MSTFLFASDLHGNVEACERLFRLPADALVLGGDLLPHPRGAGSSCSRSSATSPATGWRRGWRAVPASGRPSATTTGRPVGPFLDGLTIAGYGCVPVTPFGMKDFDR